MMTQMRLSSIGLLSIIPAFAVAESSLNINPNNALLESPYPVYVIKDSGVINHPSPGAVKVLLPTDNSYTDAPGCYIACYSHMPGVYSVSPTIYVMGQIRVRGTYLMIICYPEGYKNIDISKADQLKQLCAVKFDTCKYKSCWAGGDTGGWFGIQ